MLIETVTFTILPGMTRDDVIEDGKTTFERWSTFPGLVRKTFAMADENTAVGIYLWESEAAADRGHDEAWLDRAEAKWGNRPKIVRYDALMELDNRHSEVLEFEPVA